MNVVLWSIVSAMLLSTTLANAAPALKGKFTELKEPSLHTPGKVKLFEFADFYCPHCHHFEETIVPQLVRDFGTRLEVTMIGFPVIGGKLPTPFEMYEQAKVMGKGDQMKQALFRAIHKDHVQMFDRLIRDMLVKEVGLDPAAFEAGLASGRPLKAVEQGKQWGQRIQVQQTPTLLLDGHIKVEALDYENLKTLIQSILDADGKR